MRVEMGICGRAWRCRQCGFRGVATEILCFSLHFHSIEEFFEEFFVLLFISAKAKSKLKSFAILVWPVHPNDKNTGSKAGVPYPFHKMADSRNRSGTKGICSYFVPEKRGFGEPICTQFSVVVGVGDVAVSRTGGCALFLKSLCTSTASTMSTQ